MGGLSALLATKLGFDAKTPLNPKAANTAQPIRGFGAAITAAMRAKGLIVLALVAILGLVILLSAIDGRLIGLVCSWFSRLCTPAHPADALPWAVSIVGVSLLTIGLAFARIIDTNKFSLHAMYRARLIRAYLGASRPAGERDPDPFTGFDEQDNLYMHELRPSAGPTGDRQIHVLNLALNLVGGSNLAWQERRADSFTVSSLHAGSHRVGYRRTSAAPGQQEFSRKARDADPRPRIFGGPNGISLGTAITISGAAASPNMGYHSSPMVTFLMTLFNARLGWWLGNPGPAGDTTFNLDNPRVSIRPILAELFGRTNDANAYVYLSDGGHFENLGLYEMVLRRCRCIVVSDASCDEKCALTDLGSAIRKIRVDLGVPIEFPSEFPIRSRTPEQTPGEYCAIANIRYSRVDRKAGDNVPDTAYDGVLVYIKPAFYGNEPKDIYNYALDSPAFPHESTADQFFSESQFESYRALGYHVIESIFEKKEIRSRLDDCLGRGV